MSMTVALPPVGAPDVQGRNVLVYSLGMEGRDLTAWLLGKGARVTISDTRTREQLAAAAAVAPEGIERVVTGQPLLDPAGFDLLAVSQSVLRHDPAVLRARDLAITVISQMQLFLRLLRGPVIGITGSSGKSTTTALVGEMAAAAGIEHVVGGNIGQALLSRAAGIPAKATVVLEISHTQLQYTDRSPEIAAVTNVTPNHLDQFSWDEYVALKARLLAFQSPGDRAVLNATDSVTVARLQPDARAAVTYAAPAGRVPGASAWFADGSVQVVSGGSSTRIARRDEIQLPGEHNVANVVMACAIGVAAGFPVDAMRRAVLGFRGVPHRLEVVGGVNGTTWINDSIATSPERTMAGLRSFTEAVVLLLGGRDKNLPLAELRALAATRCRAVVCFGEAGPLFHRAVAPALDDCTLVETLADAVAAATLKARPGDIVLLSPAGTSFDAYSSFERRGEAFRALVRVLPGFEEMMR